MILLGRYKSGDSNFLTPRAGYIERGLHRVFPVQPIPSDYRRSDGFVDWEVEEDLQRILGRPWTHVGLEDWTHIVSPRAIRNGTSVEFFKYYIPSILKAVLQDIEWADQLALSALLPGNPKFEPRDEWKKFRNNFSQTQVEVVVEFLAWVREESNPASSDWYGADAALNGLWG